MTDAMELIPDNLHANRSHGEIALSVGRDAAVTRRWRVRESGSLRVRFPGAPSAELEAVLLNTAGGIAGGDRLDLDISVDTGAHLMVTTAAAEKVYRSLGPRSIINLKIAVGPKAKVTWLPRETILFNQARLRRRIEIDLAEDACLTMVESLVMGRLGMGEIMTGGELLDHWRVRRNGTLIYAEGNNLSDKISGHLAEAAVANGGAAVATALVIPADESLVDSIRAMGNEFKGEVGGSAWNGHAVMRFCANDSADLRHDVTCALSVVRAAPLPRLWVN